MLKKIKNVLKKNYQITIFNLGTLSWNNVKKNYRAIVEVN